MVQARGNGYRAGQRSTTTTRHPSLAQQQGGEQPHWTGADDHAVDRVDLGVFVNGHRDYPTLARSADVRAALAWATTWERTDPMPSISTSTLSPSWRSQAGVRA